MSENKIRASRLEDEDGLGYFAFDCPKCGETNEVSDDFKWKQGCYQMTWFCEFCDADDLVITRD